MQRNEEFFGSADRIKVAQRSANLWTLLRHSPRYAYYGRLVALSDPADDTADILTAMARIQGAAVSYYFPASSFAALSAELAAKGLELSRHEHYRGEAGAMEASRQVLATHRLPADLRLSVIDAATPAALVASVAELCQSCDVMPVPGSIMRGLSVRGLCLVAQDRAGQPVATASSYMMHHPDSPHATDAFWGMLATRNDRRGEKIALVLGAQAILHMWEKHGARGFMTGVKADNKSSQALCHRLGVGATDWVYASCLDKEQFGGTSLTR